MKHNLTEIEAKLCFSPIKHYLSPQSLLDKDANLDAIITLNINMCLLYVIIADQKNRLFKVEQTFFAGSWAC
jgi:hypothetical protein